RWPRSRPSRSPPTPQTRRPAIGERCWLSSRGRRLPPHHAARGGGRRCRSAMPALILSGRIFVGSLCHRLRGRQGPRIGRLCHGDGPPGHASPPPDASNPPTRSPRRHPKLVPDESPAALLQDGRAVGPARSVLHLAARRKLLDRGLSFAGSLPA